MYIIRKLKNSGGYSLLELLAATLIMIMVSLILTTGIPAARDACSKVTVGANAQLLLSTTVNLLRNELGTSSDVSVNTDNTVIEYTSAKTGTKAEIYLGSEDGEGIMLQEYLTYDTDTETYSRTEQLVSSTAATGNLYVIYESVDFEDAIVTFNGLEVWQSGDSGQAKAELEELNIRVIREA